MSYSVSFTRTAVKQLNKLDKTIQKRILKATDQISMLENPRSQGKSLTENWGEYWRYRVGDYRIICKIEDDQLTILVIKVGHRGAIYKTS